MNVPNDLNCNKCNNIIYVGRLTKLKKVFLLLQAFNNVISEIPESSNLILIGDGEEKIKIKDYIESYNLQNRVTLFGHVSDYALLKKYYETSLIKCFARLCRTFNYSKFRFWSSYDNIKR